ncbi:KAP family NTPase [Clostridioides difficile]|nr:KAP family NTPase [Clostridioides difficile]HBE8547489.1 hypothetical protein [Clostridioides difficile]HBG4962881.1 hypothetical protein [Clostridioides difficile]HBG6603719.1 hypothetical protein [Clostridioides difficile]HBY2738388.1 hypothetical protein [Clostridioides difficile]
MHCDEIENVIAEYLKNPREEYAVMIDGEWGSGKTYFLTHSLIRIMETIDIGKDKRRKYAYVSLYGAKSVDEVSKEIVFQYFGKKNNKKIKTADTVMETASNILTASLGAVNIDLSKIKDTLAKIDINNWIICFDDLERCCLSINEILGYINRLVEHNKCKVIVLANEKEIGKINLNQRLEEKYRVVLAGRKLLLDNEEKSNGHDTDEGIDLKRLQKEIKTLFNEDILYKSIREKVIGLTIKYEPQMDIAYDSILSNYCDGKAFKKYLAENKAKILNYFESEECLNLRTLISVFGSVQKVYDEMILNKYDTVKYFDKIMDAFLEYIVLFTIYYRNGGKVRDLKLTTEIGYVPLGQNIFSRTKGFKFLEKYCTTLCFSRQEFSRVVFLLRQEYEEEEKRIAKSKVGLAQAFGELTYWWEREDEDVKRLIIQLKKEVEEDKYPFNSYQGIISQLMVLEKNKYDVGDINSLIDVMNLNIERSDEIVDIERHSYTFENSPTLQKQYEEYIDKLKLKAGNKNQLIKSTEISQYLSSDNWAKELLDYCDKHFNEFLSRYGFIDLLDTDLLLEKIENASTQELYLTKKIFKIVYRASNINEFFMNDKGKIVELRESVGQMEFHGINKPMAQKALEDYLEDIISRLEKEENI